MYHHDGDTCFDGQALLDWSGAERNGKFNEDSALWYRACIARNTWYRTKDGS